MAGSLKDLRRRVRSISQTQKTTRAMEMVSAAKLRRAQGGLMAGRPYAEKLQALLENLSSDAELKRHPLFQKQEEGEKYLVLLTAERGLCGGFNANLIRRAEDTIKAEPGEWKLVTVGRRGTDYFRRRNADIVKSYPGSKSGLADADLCYELSDFLLEEYYAGRASEVHVIYAEFVNAAVNRPKMVKYLNLEMDEVISEDGDKNDAEVEYTMEPSRSEVLDTLLPRYLRARIINLMAEHVTSEHGARMVAMNNATKNCKELKDKLNLQMNKARQAAITSELLEIVAGAEALNG